MNPGWLDDLRTRRDGETSGQHIARVVRSCDGISLIHNRELLVALFTLNETMVRASSIAAAHTNCGTFVRQVLCAAGCKHKLITCPYVSGMAVTWVLQAAHDLKALQPSDVNSRKPVDWSVIDTGWILHYGTPGVDDDHVEVALGLVCPDTGEAPHGGGGRADNAITVLPYSDVRTSFAFGHPRPLIHLIDPSLMC